MNCLTRRVVAVTCGLVVALVLTLGSASDAFAQISFDPDGRGLSWKFGGYGTKYRWDNNGNFHSQGYGPGGVKGNYLHTPYYRGWSHWSPNHKTGSWSSPFINGGQWNSW